MESALKPDADLPAEQVKPKRIWSLREVATAVNRSYPVVSGWSDSRLAEHGFARIGRGKFAAVPKVAPAEDGIDEARLTIHEKLKLSQMRRINQQTDEGKAAIEAEFGDAVLDVLCEVFKDVAGKLREMKLTEEQCAELEKLIDLALERVRSSV